MQQPDTTSLNDSAEDGPLSLLANSSNPAIDVENAQLKAENEDLKKQRDHALTMAYRSYNGRLKAQDDARYYYEKSRKLEDKALKLELEAVYYYRKTIKMREKVEQTDPST